MIHLFWRTPPGAPLSSRRKGRERRAKGGEFRTLSPPRLTLSTTKGQGLRPLPFGNPSRLFYFRPTAYGPHFVAPLRARGPCRSTCYKVQVAGHKPINRTASGGIQWEGGRSPPLLVVGGESPERGRIETPSLWCPFASFPTRERKASPAGDNIKTQFLQK